MTTKMTRQPHAGACREPGYFAWMVASERNAQGVACDFRPAQPGRNERPTHIYMTTPGGERCQIAIAPECHDGAEGWAWDGNLDAPTLTPSIDGGADSWHGWVRAGEMT